MELGKLPLSVSTVSLTELTRSFGTYLLSLSLVSETEIAVDSPKSWENVCGQLPGSGGMDSLDE